MGMKGQVKIFGFMAAGVALFLYGVGSIALAGVSMLLGLVIVVLVGEPMIEGLQEFSLSTGLSAHVTGILSSLASNLPEFIMSMFMIMSPALREVAILSVLLASAFNGALLGILVVMVTYKGGAIEVSKYAMEHDMEIIRLAIAFCCIIVGTGVILSLNTTGVPLIPVEIPVFQLLAYASYLYFISKGAGESSDHSHLVKHEAEGGYGWVMPIMVGLVGIVISAELIAGASEFIVHSYNLNVVIAATFIGFAGSVPEHGLALIGARGGHVEMGVSNLLSGITQSIMLIFPLVALLVPVYLNGYVLYQFLAIAVTLWIVMKSIMDDGKLTLDEGISILLIHVLGILIFDELSLLF